MPRTASPEVEKRRNKVKAFFAKNPDTTVADASETLKIPVATLNQDRKHLGLTKPKKKMSVRPGKSDVGEALELISQLKTFVKDCGGISKVRAALEISEQFGELVGNENQIQQLDQLENVL